MYDGPAQPESGHRRTSRVAPPNPLPAKNQRPPGRKYLTQTWCIRVPLDIPVPLMPQCGMTKRKNPAAVSLGRLGGKVKVPKGFSMMDPKRRSEIGKAAAEKRWRKPCLA
jgi:hypothetical protein